MKPRWMSATRRLVAVAVARLVRLFLLNFEVFMMGVVIGLTLVTIPVAVELILQIIRR